QIREELRAMIGQLAVEIAVDIGVGIALSFFTFGAGALAAAGKALATIGRWIPKFAALINRLRSLIQLSKRTATVMRRAAIEAIESAVSGTIANAGASLAFGNFSWSNLGSATIASSVGGAFAGPFSHIGTQSASRVTRVSTRAAVDSVTGGAGGVAGEWAASQVTGNDFNLIMAAVTGSAGGAASGGISGIASPSSGGAHLPLATPPKPSPSQSPGSNVSSGVSTGSA